MAWFTLNSFAYKSEMKSDGGVERGIRKFSLYSSYISFFFRIFMAIIFWKDSLDFDRIIKKKPQIFVYDENKNDFWIFYVSLFKHQF